tara:strand:+ start:15189 stop:16286 length:1098 start_codon:yes stop_codon:yes gene_type:complete
MLRAKRQITNAKRVSRPFGKDSRQPDVRIDCGNGAETHFTRISRAGFSLLEVLISMTLLSALVLALAGMLDPVLKTWSNGEKRVARFQGARAALELITREVTPAVVDTRMQFVVMPAELLGDVGARHVAANSPAMLWMAPLGERNRLYCVGYYLSRDPDAKRYRLKRLFVSPNDPNGYHPKTVNESEIRGEDVHTSPVDASWFTNNWDETAFDDEDPQNEDVVVATVADGVIAFWIQCYDLLGNPIPWMSASDVHPESELIFNSAGYFSMATSVPFEDETSFRYMTDHEMVMKALRVPAELEIRIYTIDRTQLLRDIEIPEMPVIMDGDVLDLEASALEFERRLEENGVEQPQAFSTRVKLLNGS